jgi:hypothetical protein
LGAEFVLPFSVDFPSGSLRAMAKLDLPSLAINDLDDRGHPLPIIDMLSSGGFNAIPSAR